MTLTAKSSPVFPAILSKFLKLGAMLCFGAGCHLAVALAASAPGPTISGTAGVLDQTGTAIDKTFVPKTTEIKTAGGGTTYIVIEGTTTTNVPSNNDVVLQGEKLGGTNGTPLTITLGGKTLTTDDWTETIFLSGFVRLKGVVPANGD